MTSYSNIRVVTLLAILCLLPPSAGVTRAQRAVADPLWQSVDKIPAAPANARAGIRPTKFHAFKVDATLLQATLAQAPVEFSSQASQSAAPQPPVAAGQEISLPKPDGTFA